MESTFCNRRVVPMIVLGMLTRLTCLLLRVGRARHMMDLIFLCTIAIAVLAVCISCNCTAGGYTCRFLALSEESERTCYARNSCKGDLWPPLARRVSELLLIIYERNVT
jgi:hypothetical protein